ncbi:hypothetical protein BRC89_09665 [Halobacteriales archaeon QS_4_70_19]|nr:MAG: hypothetical protein BRC89_09665 [Halobacteriales archaeon QS_4_70_19]
MEVAGVPAGLGDRGGTSRSTGRLPRRSRPYVSVTVTAMVVGVRLSNTGTSTVRIPGLTGPGRNDCVASVAVT